LRRYLQLIWEIYDQVSTFIYSGSGSHYEGVGSSVIACIVVTWSHSKSFYVVVSELISCNCI